MYPGPGCVVEFLHANRPHPAWVLEEQSGKFRVLTLGKREMKLPGARILPWSGPRYDTGLSRQEILETLANHQARREELTARVDPLEIWDLAQGELTSAQVGWFAGLLWDGPDPDRLAAMGRALLQQKTHFKFRPPEFEIHAAEKVEARLAEMEAARERDRITAQGQTFFQDLWKARSKREAPPTPLDEDVAEKLKNLLFSMMAHTGDQEGQNLWNAVRRGLPDLPCLPLLLAQAWGLVPEHHNAFLDQEGYVWGDGWARPFERDVKEQAEKFMSPDHVPEPGGYISIDSATTLDIDDAFSINTEQDGGYSLRLALACPALAWEFGSKLDLAVRDRASSLYLPEGTSHMLPEAFGLEVCSLRQGEARPALVLEFTFSPEAEVLSTDLNLTWVRVGENTSYEKAEENLRGPAPDPGLALGLDLAEKLRQRRVEKGAVVILRPDPKIVLSGEGKDLTVDMTTPPPCPRAQLLVSELMILANSAAGLWARENELPFLFRTQDITLPKDVAGVWERPEHAYQAVRLMGNTLLEATARPHACLGVPAYGPVTSPLRRYPDLLNQGQILHFIKHQRPKWEKQELEKMLPYINARVEAAGRIQRFRTKYWKLVYLKQHRDRAFESTVVEDGAFVSVSLPGEQVFIRAKREIFGEKVFAGKRFQVRLEKISPLDNEVRIAEALEA